MRDDTVDTPTGPSEASQTDWSMIYDAARGEPEPSAEAWDLLGRRYWPAIYAYIRSSGRNIDDASDLTQGFVCDVLIGRGRCWGRSAGCIHPFIRMK